MMSNIHHHHHVVVVVGRTLVVVAGSILVEVEDLVDSIHLVVVEEDLVDSKTKKIVSTSSFLIT